MSSRPLFRCTAALILSASVARCTVSLPSAASLAGDFSRITIDPAHTFRVRELEISHGDIKIYLNEGVLAFLTPIDGRTVGAVFTTKGVESGDGEVILLPPQRSERASLASFTKSPNLDEHFDSALFLFTDTTAQDLLGEINQNEVREAPDLAPELAAEFDPAARGVSGQLAVALISDLLDRHDPKNGLFYSVIGGRTLGAFDITFDPTQEEPVFAGRVSPSGSHTYQLWTNFRPRHFLPPAIAPSTVEDYRIDTTIRPDLSVDIAASFLFNATPQDGRALPLSLSPHLRVSSASVDGQPAEVLQRPPSRLPGAVDADSFLVAAPSVLVPGVPHRIVLRYTGRIIRRTELGDYFVDDRNAWYPVKGVQTASFDLTFHCPEKLRLVSTGELISDRIQDGEREVHRKTVVPAVLAGFNLGEYSVRETAAKPYKIDVYSPSTALSKLTADRTLAAQTADILAEYTRLWVPLSFSQIAISPIPGYFGQGFPGLIFLSNVAYMREEDRAAALRNPRYDAFFSELLLPHEIAHQWWGNIVRQSDYRSAWITEAMANESALEHIERSRGTAARDEILENYRQDLTASKNGKGADAAGPVDFGERLLETDGFAAWNLILYEKGSWILHMLRARLGTANYREMQLQLLHDYANRPLSNEDFRRTASEFVPKGQPDRQLTDFFETWIYGTGIPHLRLQRIGTSMDLELSGVDQDFLLDVPLNCKGVATHWIRAVYGDNNFELPKGASSCELPSTHDFLYISRNSH